MSFTQALIYDHSTLHIIFVVHIQLRGHINWISAHMTGTFTYIGQWYHINRQGPLLL